MRDDMRGVMPSPGKLAVLHERFAVEFDGAMAQRQVEMSQRMAAGDFVGAGGVEEIAGEGALLGAVDVALVIQGQRIPARAGVHAPADVRYRVGLAVSPGGEVFA